MKFSAYPSRRILLLASLSFLTTLASPAVQAHEGETRSRWSEPVLQRQASGCYTVSRTQFKERLVYELPRIFIYARADNGTQWARWNEGFRTPGQLFFGKWYQNQRGHRYADDIAAALRRNAELMNTELPPGSALVFTESGQIVGRVATSAVANRGSYNAAAAAGYYHYSEGFGVNINGRDLPVVAMALSSPVALDLDHSGRIEVTGKASGYVRFDEAKGFTLPDSVQFDLKAIGKPGRFEWLKGGRDGFLVDDREGRVTRAARENQPLDGNDLFGGQRFGNGYAKLGALFDREARLAASSPMKKLPEGLGVLKGNELEGLKVWRDLNQDARPQPGELSDLASLGITELGTRIKWIESREDLRMTSWFVQNGKRHMTEDVWFAEGPEPPAS
ncbi:MAG: hypothetical protein VKO64_09750 [Candidatus Sericytochromatia bacterium]|nr:hypothetical protein [Candidatus Sericytochromatia bacterium]